MKIKFQLFALVSAFAFIFMFAQSNTVFATAVVGPEGYQSGVDGEDSTSGETPGGYQSEVEGENATEGENPSSYQSEVEGEESISGDSPTSYQSGVDGEDSTSGEIPGGYQSGVEGEEGPSEVTEPTPNTQSTSGRGRSGGSRRTTSNTPTGNLSAGEVLGASTDGGSCKLITTFMKIGLSNNVEEVKMVQTFLNSTMNAGLPVTGFYGPLTFQAVKNFQAKYATEILKPWIEVGLMKDVTPTGYLYKTTQYAINKMLCPEAELVAPTLN